MVKLEIERKFLVKDRGFISEAASKSYLKQGYLSSHPERSVRVRIYEDKGFLTIKGKSDASGIKRLEWEREIPLTEAEDLLKFCEAGIIEKCRYLVPKGQHCFEVDVFEGDNMGLIIAEVELREENEPFHHPSWLGKEVTGQSKYYNAQLKNKPFTKW